MTKDQQQEIIFEFDPKQYRTEIPNILDDVNVMDEYPDLDVYERSLLWHYYRRGRTFEGTRTTAKHTGMSVGQVVKKRRSLASKGYIRITEPDSPEDTIKIEIVDFWSINFDHFSGGVHGVNTPVHGANERVNSNPLNESDIKDSVNSLVHGVNAPVHGANTYPQESPTYPQLTKPQVFRKLILYGVAESAAREIMTGYSIEHVSEYFEAFEWYRREHRPKSAGWLVQAIRESYQLPRHMRDRKKADDRGRYTRGEHSDAIIH